MTRPDENELTDEEATDLSALLRNANLWAAPSPGLRRLGAERAVTQVG